MADCSESTNTVRDYLNGLLPGYTVSDGTLFNILAKVGISCELPTEYLTERDRDLLYAYLIIYMSPGFGSSQKVTDRDGDWEHSESTSSWSYQDRYGLWRIARALLAKWGIEDPLLEAAIPKWGFKGTGFRKIRRYHR